MSIDSRIARFAAPWVRELTPYHVEESDDLVKLDAMENPYPLPEQLRESWLRALEAVEVNRYPDPGARVLRQQLRDYHAIGDGCDVILGNGSDELIHMLCLAFAQREGATMLCPDPSFAVYAIAAQSVGMSFERVALDPADFTLDETRMLEAIERHQPALVFLASPNNPTANRIAEGVLGPVCERAPGVVVLDEAYYRFAGGESHVGDLERYENLLVMHTLSKVGMAGLRVGALFGAREWLDLLERVRMPYNISSLSQAGASFALAHDGVFQQQIDAIVAAREALCAALRRLPGVHAWDSETNFVLTRMPAGTAGDVFRRLKERGILVKNLSSGHPALADCLRLTVGTPAENTALVNALADCLS